MNASAKQKLYDQFLRKWGERFEQVAFVLDYVRSYPELVSRIEDFEPLSADELEDSQREWISLVAQLTHPLDVDFFHDYWVSVQAGAYAYFIDLSSDTLSIFEYHYVFQEPYGWYKKYWFRDIRDWMLLVDDPSIPLDKIRRDNFNDCIEDIGRITGKKD